jgi:hypothetical protein
MRLTLRTLLAWMDGVLPEAAARQLADKVAGSAVARTLAGRIRDVVSRPTVGAPPADGRGLAADPNSAAEFLDNVLDPDRLAEFERVCIESDMQLAEVADCHRLLADQTAGRGAVAAVDAELEARLRAVVAAEVRRDAVADRHAEATANARALRDALAAAEDDTELVSGADVGRMSPVASQTPSRTWALAATAAVVLIGLVGVLGWTVMRSGRREVAKKPPAVAEAARPEAADSPLAAALTEAAVPLDQPAVARIEPPTAPATAADSRPGLPEPGQGGPARDATGSEPPKNIEAEIPPRESVPPSAPPPPTAIAARVPQGEALAIAASVPAPVPAPPAPATPVAAAVEPTRQDPVVAGPFVLLVGTAAAAEQPLVWQARRAEAVVPVPAELASPLFSQPELIIDGVRIRFAPASRATLLRDGDGSARLDVLFGRAVVVAEDPAARLGITAAGISGRVLRGLEAPLGVEVTFDRVPGSDPADGTATRRARFMSAGGLVWDQTAEDGGVATEPLAGFDADGRIAAGTLVEWSSAAPDAVALKPGAGVPGWLVGGAEIDAADRQAALALATRLPAEGPVQPGLRHLAGDPRGEQRVLAAATLALLGDYEEVVRQLSADERGRELYAGQWSKLESLTVPLALARGANAAARLAKAFAEHGPAGSGESLARLARGFSPADLAAGADAWLVDALEDPQLVVRRYAFQRLTELANPPAVDRLRYRPDGRPEQRREGVAWWREAVEQGRLRAALPPLP